MRGAAEPSPRGRRWRTLDEPQVRVALVAAACLMAEAVVAKNVVQADLGVVSQLAPLWVFIAYLVSDLRDRASEIAFTVAVVAVTTGVLVLHAV